jgi:hypothetical protein
MTEGVQRHDVACENAPEGEAILAEFRAFSKAADIMVLRWLAWIIGPPAIFTAALYLAAVAG